MRIRRAEHGFTMPEVLLVVVLTGIITAVIGQALLISYETFTPGNDRTEFATEVNLLNTYMSDDLANAASVIENPFVVLLTTSADCDTPQATSLFGVPAPWGWTDLKFVNMQDGSTRAYDVVRTQPEDDGYLRVQVRRAIGSNVTVLIDGWCKRGDTGLFNVSYDNPSYTIDLKIKPSKNTDYRRVKLTADRRTLPEPSLATTTSTTTP